MRQDTGVMMLNSLDRPCATTLRITNIINLRKTCAFRTCGRSHSTERHSNSTVSETSTRHNKFTNARNSRPNCAACKQAHVKLKTRVCWMRLYMCGETHRKLLLRLYAFHVWGLTFQRCALLNLRAFDKTFWNLKRPTNKCALCAAFYFLIFFYLYSFYNMRCWSF